MEELIKLKNVKKTYTIGEKSFNALDGVSFSITINLQCNSAEVIVSVGIGLAHAELFTILFN